MQSKQAWFVGECMVELRRVGERILAQTFAGDAYNSAVYFSRMSGDLATHFVSAVGEDQLSDALVAEARRQGLEIEQVVRVRDCLPGLYLIETSQRGERSFFYWRDQSAARLMLDEAHAARLHAAVDACRLLYFSGITLAVLDDERRERLLALARTIRGRGGWVAFDSNYRPRLWRNRDQAAHWVGAALAVASHVLVTFDDEAQLHADASPAATLRRVSASGAEEAVVKLGAEGCVVRASAGDEVLAIAAETAIALDTTAAGDSFNAGYLAARLRGLSREAAARAGARLAARVVVIPGAIIDRGAMQDLLVDRPQVR